jgi:hypothetical protein
LIIFFCHTWTKPNKTNGAIVEKVQWCNSKKKVNRP